MASSTTQRVAAITIAILFLVTSLGFSGLVIWEITRQNQKDQATADNLNQQAEENSQQKKEDSLEGTKLADFEPIDKVEKLKKIDIKVGSGDEVKAGDTVTAHYTGAIAKTGIIFQSSLDGGQPIPFGLDSVIQGWTEGVPGMKVGGTRRLLIPASMAYKDTPPQGSNIPPNADLVFDIQLVKIGE